MSSYQTDLGEVSYAGYLAASGSVSLVIGEPLPAWDEQAWRLLDVANLYTAQVNFELDPIATLDALPLDRVGYAHVAGGVLRDGIWHDTHAHPVSQDILGILAALAERTRLPGAMLERDDAYPSDAELAAEIAAIREVLHAVSEH